MSRVVDRWHRADKTRTPLYGKGSRWQAVWTDGRGGEEKRAFTAKDAAQAWINDQEAKHATGTRVAKGRDRTLVSELVDDWLTSQTHWRDATRDEVADTLRVHVLPEWGDTQVGVIDRASLQAWVNTLSRTRAPRTVDTIYGRFRSFLTWCAEERYIPRAPTTGVNLPAGNARDHYYLTVEEYGRLREAMDPHYRPALDLAVTTGVRPSELWELRAGDVDLTRRRVHVRRAVRHVKAGTVVAPPKNAKPREVPLIPWVAEELAERITGARRDTLLFTTPNGAQVRENNFGRRYWKAAVEASGLPADLRFYDLRHTAASWAIRSGASVKAIQRMLGHKTAAITLQVYAGLYDEELDTVAERIGKLLDRPETAQDPPQPA